MSRLSRFTARFVTYLLILAPMALVAQDNVTRIAAASSMRFVLDDLIDAYEVATGDTSLQAVYGSSGNLYRQILQGAPYDMFLSADSQYTNALQRDNKEVQISVFATGTLMLYRPSREGSGTLLTDMTNALRDREVAGKRLKIAIANPGHAPFGRAARQVLQSLSLWEKSQSHLIIADNVSQATQFARTGAVEYAFVARSLVHNLTGEHEVVPQQYYRPLQITLATLVATPATSRFQRFIQSSRASESFNKYQLKR